MSDLGLFIAGSVVTAIVVVSLVALFYAAILDGRFEEQSRTDVVQPGRESGDGSRRG